MNGILIINKHKGCSSHDIVYKVKKICNEKVGHTGTLDPMATGVLPLLLGKGTLCSKYLINHDKIYKATIQLGIETDTLDSEGKILNEQEVNSQILERKNVENVLKLFLGKQEQIPPMYSSIKIKGKKLYQYAREGKEVELEPRKIEIYNIKLLDIDKNSNQIKIEINCSKGTYIRSLCRDISKQLETIGYMKDLERIQVGDFNIKDSIKIADIEDDVSIIEEHLITVEEIFKDKESINLDNKKLQLFLNGVKLDVKCKDDTYKIYNNSKFIGTGIVKDFVLKRDIVL